MFRSTVSLGPLYEQLVGQSVLNVASFLGRPITPSLEQEIDSKHRFGKCSIKILTNTAVLRIETTTNDVFFFKHRRKVKHRTGAATREPVHRDAARQSLVHDPAW